MQQLRQTFLSFGLVFESHDVEEVSDSELKEIKAHEREQCRSWLEKSATTPAAGTSRGRSARGE